MASQASSTKKRAEEVSTLLDSLQNLIIPYIKAADLASLDKSAVNRFPVAESVGRTALVEPQEPRELEGLLGPDLPETGRGANGVLEAARSLLRYSVNTWDAGFLDKLYASTDAPGLAAELLLAALNTNVHVYTVSPALTLIEKHTTQSLAHLFGLHGSNAGGVTVPGGAASNMTSMLIARNNMFPQTKTLGIAGITTAPIVFTSTQSHYSISTAATQLGIGSVNVRKIPTISHGAMDVDALEEEIVAAQKLGLKPFYVCATAGTTVTGAYDSLEAIAKVCKRHKLWMHVDACWGGPAIFSPKLRDLLAGSTNADSIAVNPHKMLGVPMTCSFLLGADMRHFYVANNLEAGYLFHGKDHGEEANGHQSSTGGESDFLRHVPTWNDVYDLAKYTPQCGRRGDALKMYLAWQYYGNEGFARKVEAAFMAARTVAAALARDDRVELLNGNPPPCCQVCFRYVGHQRKLEAGPPARSKEYNSNVTRGIVAVLVRKGWMVDYSTGMDGEYMRVVCNHTTAGSQVAEHLVEAILASGEEVLDALSR